MARTSIFRRVWRELNAYRRYLHETRTEMMVVFAFAAILLAAGDALCSWLLGLLAPSLASRFDALEKGRRVLFSGVPLATIFLAATVGAHWWGARRSGELRPYLRDLENGD